jgi:hypothetical protein
LGDVQTTEHDASFELNAEASKLADMPGSPDVSKDTMNSNADSIWKENQS